jgi:hypothetical protein
VRPRRAMLEDNKRKLLRPINTWHMAASISHNRRPYARLLFKACMSPSIQLLQHYILLFLVMQINHTNKKIRKERGIASHASTLAKSQEHKGLDRINFINCMLPLQFSTR